MYTVVVRNEDGEPVAVEREYEAGEREYYEGDDDYCDGPEDWYDPDAYEEEDG